VRQPEKPALVEHNAQSRKTLEDALGDQAHEVSHV
jgi:hypothetical protein